MLLAQGKIQHTQQEENVCHVFVGYKDISTELFALIML